jgi:parallel beta-helix repeat protein
MRPRLAALAAAALAVVLLVPVASVSAASTITVHPGQSIQAAINKAPAGALISVESGTYKGNLDITRSVRLVGHDAVIKPAAKPTSNACLALAPGVMGICVHGVFNADGSMKSTISNVSIEGFTVRDFSGAGMIVAGVEGFLVARVVTAHNRWMGMLVDTSTNVSLLNNRSYGNGADGIQLGDAPSANAVITGNESYGNLGAGILFVDSKGGLIERNAAHGNCVGIVVAATGTPGQSGSGDVSVQLNQVTANNRWCPAVPNSVPAYGGIGIAIMGAQGTTVALNDVRDNVAQAGTGITGGGIVLLEAAIFGAGAPTGNSIRLNWLSGNTPNDIYGDGTGTGNTVSGNSCTKTNLVAAC